MKTVQKISRSILGVVICIGMVLIAVSGCASLSSEKPAVAQNLSSQNDDALITTLIASLWSATDQVRTDSEKRIIAFANGSGAKRELVINKLLGSVNSEKELDGTHNILETSFLYWKSVTNIFTELNAYEAVDVLIRCVQCSNGWNGSMGEPPASQALVRMGKPILGKLSEALRQESDEYKRMKLVLCIARIGGAEAITHLEQALQSESHKEVREIIEFNLSQMKSKD